jgi:sec-independent protein translocase protein TatC
MFGLNPLSLFFIVMLVIVIVGPRMLPASIEGVWLAITNLQRSQRNEEGLSLEQARTVWKANRSALFQLIEVLKAVVEHLEEMRSRIIRVLLALALGTIICLVFYNQIYAFLLKPISNLTVPPAPGEPTSNATVLTLNKPQVVTATVILQEQTSSGTVTTSTVPAQITLPKGIQLSVDLPEQPQRIRPVFLQPTEMFVTTFRVCLLGGVALALPIIIYEVIAFIWPALIYEHERRWVYLIVPFASVFFVGGMVFSYFFLVPFALRYLLTFGAGIAVAMPSIGSYISFTTNLMFWIGMVFQTPLVVFFLAKLKIVPYAKLKSFWKFAVLISFVVGALITPTPDPINQTLVSVPIFLLYMLGVLLARFA